MIKKIISLLLIGVFVALMVGCAAHVHTIGKGPQKGEYTEARQWYILFGLVPLNTVDTAEMAEDATDYEIKTENSALDIIMNIFTSYISVTSRTVTVTR
jgi:hypothetical protein